MRKIIYSICFLFLLMVPPRVWAADLEAGVAAFDKENYAEALKHFTPLANAGNTDAQSYLGEMYYMGLGVTVNYKKARQLLTAAADKDEPVAMYNLGFMYLLGDGIPENHETAFKWFLGSAKLGDSGAQVMVGRQYEEGDGVQKNLQEAAKWYRAAADAGVGEAQNALAGMYVFGKGVKQNFKEAMRLLKAAADQGNAHAMSRIGEMYRRGLGVTKNNAEAIRWFRKSADNGHAPAMHMLGDHYADGRGVEKDLQESYRWYSMAAKNGYSGAVKRANEVKGIMKWKYIGKKVASDNIVEVLFGGIVAENKNGARIGVNCADSDIAANGMATSFAFFHPNITTDYMIEKGGLKGNHHVVRIYPDGNKFALTLQDWEWSKRGSGFGYFYAFDELDRKYIKQTLDLISQSQRKITVVVGRTSFDFSLDGAKEAIQKISRECRLN